MKRVRTGLAEKYSCIVCDYKRGLLKLRRTSGGGGVEFFLIVGGASYYYESEGFYQCVACGFKFKEDEWSVTYPCAYHYGPFFDNDDAKHAQFTSAISGVDLISKLETGACDDCVDFIEEYRKGGFHFGDNEKRPPGCQICGDTRVDVKHPPHQVKFTKVTTQKTHSFWQGDHTKTTTEKIAMNLCAKHVKVHENDEDFEIIR